jgi:hypothetical protein
MAEAQGIRTGNGGIVADLAASVVVDLDPSNSATDPSAWIRGSLRCEELARYAARALQTLQAVRPIGLPPRK